MGRRPVSLTRAVCSAKIKRYGRVSERLKEAVLKTVNFVRGSWVRIPSLPPYMLAAVFRCGAFFLKRGFSWLFLDAKSIWWDKSAALPVWLSVRWFIQRGWICFLYRTTSLTAVWPVCLLFHTYAGPQGPALLLFTDLFRSFSFFISFLEFNHNFFNSPSHFAHIFPVY